MGKGPARKWVDKKDGGGKARGGKLGLGWTLLPHRSYMLWLWLESRVG